MPEGIGYDDNHWETEEDLRALKRVNDMKHDPDRLGRAEQMAKDQIKSLREATGMSDKDAETIRRGYEVPTLD